MNSENSTDTSMTRRSFIKASGSTALAAGIIGFPSIVTARKSIGKTIVLGFDGMDPGLLSIYMQRGLMPNCKKLMQKGVFQSLATTVPPQSPVAWSSFISGANPGQHGIFDFIARDAESLIPFLSTSKTEPPKHNLKLGKFSIPLSKGKTELLRKGPTLWDILQKADVDSDVLLAPVNFPPGKTKANTLSGLTTPDIHGSYGIFSLFTDDPKWQTKNVAGGQIERVQISNRQVRCILHGPTNSFKKESHSIDVPINVTINSERTMAQINIQNHKLLLKTGEWSKWLSLDFELVPHLAAQTGMCRLFLKSTKPFFELYVSPINIDPRDPAMPISSPDNFSHKMASEIGPFYTQGMPEDTSALMTGVFNDDQYRAQATLSFKEQLRIADYGLNNFKSGFLYLYFSTLDLNSHAFFRCIDTKHPAYDEKTTQRHGDFLPWIYSQLDRVVGKAASLLSDSDTLMVVSDHGFCSFRRQFNLNSWLMDNNYAAPRDRFSRGETDFFLNTDWNRTRAYGLGINSLYLNIRGREPNGIVTSGEEANTLCSELIKRLTSIIDPETGDTVITNVYRPTEIYSGPYVKNAPDLVVCYNKNYRASWDTILGKYPKEVLLDNNDAWSGDHCMDPQFIPGVFLSNRKTNTESPSIEDMAPSILSLYKLPIPKEMTGSNVFKA